MNKLSQKELKVIGDFCGDGYVKRLRAVQERKNNNVVRIVNTGMVSSGKSSLYNILINSNEEYFPTGAARTTTKANYFDYNNISYIDTPGIDVRSEDDALAFSTIIESDIIMMIHNIRTGPLNRSEAEWLEQIRRKMSNAEMCQSRIVFVVSWKDTREKEEDYVPLINNLKKQVFKIIGVEIPFFEVSVKKYQQGIRKGKEVLVKNSGIQELKEYLERYATEYLEKKKRMDKEEYTTIMREVKNILQEEHDSKTKEKKKILDRVRRSHNARKSAWEQVYDCFSAQRNQLSSMESELNLLECPGIASIFKKI